MRSQRHLFPETAVNGYLNGASRAPQLKAVAAAARHAIWWREENPGMPIAAFFDTVEEIKQTFADLIGCAEPGRVALTPSASYGLATAAKNLPLAKGQNVIVVEAQFPSNYYAWDVLCGERNAELRVVARPKQGEPDSWSDRVLAAIDTNTAAVAIGQVHWADGTLYDLQAIRDRTDDVGAWLIVDGTQSIGAYPFDVKKIRPDVLACGGYKWLMGPYGCGYAYFGERLDHGRPLEENWINRAGSEDFRNLVSYRSDYRPLAARYSVGEHSNFLMVPMQLAGLQQARAWGAEAVQTYCANLWAPILPTLDELGVTYQRDRAHHLVGLRLPDRMEGAKVAAAIVERGLMVSYRGDAVRVSPNVYNEAFEMGLLVAGLGG